MYSSSIGCISPQSASLVRMALCGWLLASWTNAFAEAQVKGYVVQLTERGKPMAQVQISSDGQHQVSLSDGRFELNFAQRQPGNLIRLVVQRTGWDVVNRHVLDHTLTTQAGDQPVEIIVAPTAEREQYALSYYRLKGGQVLDKQLQRRLAELEARHTVTAEERASLQQERDKALKQVEELARELASAKPGETSTSYSQALKLFLDGELDAALALLSEAHLNEEAAKAQEQLRQAVEGWQLRAKMLTVKLDFSGAARAYKKTIELLPQDWDTWFKYAFFQGTQNDLTLARKGYERALELALRSNQREWVAHTLYNLGGVYMTENRLDDAREAYEEALTRYRVLARMNPQEYMHKVAGALNNLGIVHRAENRMTQARAAYEEALKRRRALAQKNPELYQSDVAGTLNNLGLLHLAENRIAEARSAFEEALQIVRALAQKTPGLYLNEVAITLSNLGMLHQAENRIAEARAALEEAVMHFRVLEQKYPELYRRNVARTLNGLGNLYRIENRTVEARATFEEALQRARTMAEKNPEVYLGDVALILESLGALNSAEDHLAAARDNFREALTLYRALAQKNPELYLHDVARTLNSLGTVLGTGIRTPEARGAFEEALTLYRALAQVNPEAYLSKVAGTLNDLGNLLTIENRMAEARAALEEALKIYQKLVLKSESYRVMLNDVLQRLNSLEK